jgi:hypothetical protein
MLQIAQGRRVRPRKAENFRSHDRNAEARIQAAIVEWIRLVASELIAFHVPNGGLRTKAEAARMKRVGVLAGVPDVVVLGLDGRAWLIEVKGPGGSLSAEQCVIRDRCVSLRIPFVVAKSIDDVRRAFEIWGIETREVRPWTSCVIDHVAHRGARCAETDRLITAPPTVLIALAIRQGGGQ